jgi:hypothetical protein
MAVKYIFMAIRGDAEGVEIRESDVGDEGEKLSGTTFMEV